MCQGCRQITGANGVESFEPTMCDARVVVLGYTACDLKDARKSTRIQLALYIWNRRSWRHQCSASETQTHVSVEELRNRRQYSRQSCSDSRERQDALHRSDGIGSARMCLGGQDGDDTSALFQCTSQLQC